MHIDLRLGMKDEAVQLDIPLSTRQVFSIEIGPPRPHIGFAPAFVAFRTAACSCSPISGFRFGIASNRLRFRLCTVAGFGNDVATCPVGVSTNASSAAAAAQTGSLQV